MLRAAVKKYGEQSFIKNVCFIFDNADEAFAKEFELIETYRTDPLCYNLRQGGSGGFDWINKKSDQTWRRELGRQSQNNRSSENFLAGRAAANARRKVDEEFAKLMFDTTRVSFLRRKHSTATKDLIRKKMKAVGLGEANSQYGTCWVTDGSTTRKIMEVNHL